MSLSIYHSNDGGARSVPVPQDYPDMAFLVADCNGGTLTAYMNSKEVTTLVLPVRKNEESLKNFYNRISSYPAVCEFWNAICFNLRGIMAVFAKHGVFCDAVSFFVKNHKLGK